MSKVLSAVAWPYANGPRHIGHVAGFGVPSDVFSRYMRMAGHDVLMVSGTDEHGTPILVQAEKEGVAPRDRRPVQPDHRRGPHRARARLRPLHPHDDAEPLRRGPGAVHRGLAQRLHDRADDPRGDQPVDRAHPARPLHRGHLPDLRLHRGARRPVRQLRQPARRDRASSTRGARSTARCRSSSRPSTSSSTCPRSPTRSGSGSTAARRPAPGGPTSSSSAATSSTTSARAR